MYIWGSFNRKRNDMKFNNVHPWWPRALAKCTRVSFRGQNWPKYGVNCHRNNLTQMTRDATCGWGLFMSMVMVECVTATDADGTKHQTKVRVPRLTLYSASNGNPIPDTILAVHPFQESEGEEYLLVSMATMVTPCYISVGDIIT